MAKTGNNQSCLELAKSDEMYALIKAKYEEKIAQKEELNQRIKQKTAKAAAAGEATIEEGDEETMMNQDMVAEDTMGMISTSSSSSTSVAAMAVNTKEKTANSEEVPSVLGVRKAEEMTRDDSAATATATAQQKRKMRMKSAAGSVGVKLSHLGDDEDD